MSQVLMKLFSTNGEAPTATLQDAIMSGQAPDGGLYLPEQLPQIDCTSHQDKSFQEIALSVASHFFTDIQSDRLSHIIQQAFPFAPKTIELDPQISVMELFHGPTLAFKDFGARFMAQIMSYYTETSAESAKKLTILVATSGDTGGAVASAFHKVPNIDVVILYPSGMVSELQEKQLTTFGDNIYAIEVEGTFDDCQKFVKSAFRDEGFNKSFKLTSANSINIARLIPQSFYYFAAVASLQKDNLVFSVPSGNFGNVAAGLMASLMGMPVKHFISATNRNGKVVSDYLKTGVFEPKSSVSTISNAMDVGNPSNLARIQNFYNSDIPKITDNLSVPYFTDEETKIAINEVKEQYDYLMCPHTAVGYLGAKQHLAKNPDNHIVIAATAHPAKFKSEVDTLMDIPLPPELASLIDLKKEASKVENDYQQIKSTVYQLLGLSLIHI